MKNRILILIGVLLMAGHVFGQLVQEDLQWLIRDGKGKDGLESFSSYNNYFSNSIANEFILENVAPPNSDLLINGIAKKRNNDFFVIYKNGDYSMFSEKYPNTNFAFKSGQDISYLYLTNKYEGDDLPKNVKAKAISSGSPSPVLIGPPSNSLYYHQDIVDNSDITFIFSQQSIAQCNLNNFNLCYENNAVNFQPSSFKIGEEKNVILQNSTSQNIGYGTSAFTNFNNSGIKKCISVSIANGNVFMNFRPVIDWNLLSNTSNPQIQFYIESISNGGNPCILEPIQVSDQFHDPNYVELKCVWSEDNKKFARYHVECFNNGSGSVGNVKMTLKLPDNVKANTVNITKWRVGNATGCGTKIFGAIASKISSIISNQLLTINLPVPELTNSISLSGLPINQEPSNPHISWVEFCVELNINTKLLIDDLRPENPFTTFTSGGISVEYPIDTYIDITKNIKPRKKGDKIRRNRKNTTKCGSCSCLPQPEPTTSQNNQQIGN